MVLVCDRSDTLPKRGHATTLELLSRRSYSPMKGSSPRDRLQTEDNPKTKPLPMCEQERRSFREKVLGLCSETGSMMVILSSGCRDRSFPIAHASGNFNLFPEASKT